MKYLIGEKEFKSKKEAKFFVSNFLRENIEIDDTNKQWVLCLLQNHPRWIEKSKDLNKIIIKKTDRHQNAFHLVKNNGDIEDISYIKCFDGESESMLLYKTLRHEIEYQIKVYRHECFEILPVKCQLCSCNLKNDPHTHIDHIIPFSNIAKQFILNEPHIETKSIGYKRIIINNSIKEKWHDFHNKLAELRPLCAKCNLSLPIL